VGVGVEFDISTLKLQFGVGVGVGVLVGVLVGPIGVGVLVGGIGVLVGGIGVLVGGIGVLVGVGVGVGVFVAVGVGVAVGIPTMEIHCDTLHRPIDSTLILVVPIGISPIFLGKLETKTLVYPDNETQLVQLLSVQAYNFTDVISSPTVPKFTDATNDGIIYFIIDWLYFIVSNTTLTFNSHSFDTISFNSTILQSSSITTL